MAERSAEEEADDLRRRLVLYRGVKEASVWLRERLQERRDETFWPGAEEKPTGDRQLRL